MGGIASCCKKEIDEAQDPLIHNEPTVGLQDFEKIKIIGTGNFGKVFLVKRKGTQDFFAMKILKKSLIDEKKQRAHTITERRVLENAKCPFVVKLVRAFQDSKKLYMIMEYMNGGELFFYLNKEGMFSEIRSRFYLAEILVGLNYLHANGIIYRDLKPENILLDNEGHIKLTDFGLSKSGIDVSNPKAYTFCGTPEYLAPEILRNLGYDKSVDFWSLGALMYYMLSGAPPFYSKNKSETFKNVLTKSIEALPNVTDEANDLLQKLLKVDVIFI
jgi:serine/threonine protein kinase